MAGLTSSSSGISFSGYQSSLSGAFDAFLVKFNSSGIRQWGTYYGGNGGESGYSISTDGSGNVYLSGETSSTFNMASGGHQNSFGGGGTDAFLVKFNSSGALQWGTYYGGNGDEIGYSTSIDLFGDIYLSGHTGSAAAIAFGGHQNSYGGGTYDAFLVKFNSNGVRQWGT